MSSQKTGFFSFIYRFIAHWRYPASMPDDIARTLGIPFSNYVCFEEFLNSLVKESLIVPKLKKFMPRFQAEKIFHNALKKEKFKQNSLYSYYFPQGWLEFVLVFDDQARLRRVYIQHKDLEKSCELKIDQ